MGLEVCRVCCDAVLLRLWCVVWPVGGAEPSDALDWARNSVVQATSSVKFAGEDDVDAFGFEEVRILADSRLTPQHSSSFY